MSTLGTTCIRVGSLFDGSRWSDKPCYVEVGAGEILRIATDLPGDQAIGRNYEDFSDKVLMPLFVESHAHIFLQGGDMDMNRRSAYQNQTPEILNALAKERMKILMKLGIGALRDGGDKDGVGLSMAEVSQAIDNDPLPVIESPGAAVHKQGRYGSFFAQAIEEHDSLENCVLSRFQHGAKHLKIVPTGIINFKKGAVTAAPQMTTAEVSLMCAAAHTRQMRVMAHASGAAGIQVALDGGVDSIEHGYFITDDQLKQMRDKGTVWVPTLVPVQVQVDRADEMGWDAEIVDNLKKILDGHARSIILAKKMGVTVLAGSDGGSCGVAHGEGLIRELELLQAIGLDTPYLLSSCGKLAGGQFSKGVGLGEIAVGGPSRFMLCDKRAATEITKLWQSRRVFADGIEIDTELSDAERALL